MSKKFENIIIDGDVRNIFTSYYSKQDIIELVPYKMYRFTSAKLPCSSSEMYAKDTNALYILNKYLAKIIENKGEYKQIKIYVNSSLYNKITTGKYKYWVENKATQSGTPLADKEYEQWARFAELYKEVFTKINWYQTRLFDMKDFKYNKDEMNYGREVYRQLHFKLIQKAEEDLKRNLMM